MDDKVIWVEELDILHNIEHRETAQKMKGATEPILSSTTYEKIEGEEDDG